MIPADATLGQKQAPGGGFVLTDTHGEIPFQVADEVLLAIRHAAVHWRAGEMEAMLLAPSGAATGGIRLGGFHG